MLCDKKRRSLAKMVRAIGRMSDREKMALDLLIKRGSVVMPVKEETKQLASDLLAMIDHEIGPDQFVEIPEYITVSA